LISGVPLGDPFEYTIPCARPVTDRIGLVEGPVDRPTDRVIAGAAVSRWRALVLSMIIVVVPGPGVVRTLHRLMVGPVEAVEFRTVSRRPPTTSHN
jgi:hypothetical protein